MNNFKYLYFTSGTRVGRVRVIFQLPQHIDAGSGPQVVPNAWPKDPLAYVEWYGVQRSLPDENTGMYVIKKTTESQYSIVTLTSIRQSCMLLPRFDDYVDWKSSWTSENVLDNASLFYLNNWQSSYAYQTIW